MTIWMVRAGGQGENENLALGKGLVVVGWEDLGDLSFVSTQEELRTLCENTYQDASRSRISNFVGQLWSFKDRIQIGDLVALPLKTQSSAIALGKVTGDYKYVSNNPFDAKHTRKVDWIQTDIPRSNFGQDLLYSLGAFMTVCRIKRNNADERIKVILNGAPDPNLTSPLPEPGVEPDDTETEPPLDIEQYSKDQIHAYIGAKFKGHELSRLVTSILKAQGYKTEMSPPGPDGGLDIIAGQGAMGFNPPRLGVQVKSGGGSVDVTILRELKGVLKNFGAEQGLLVSWGGFKSSVYKESRTLLFEIRLWDADTLIQNLIDYYDKLPDTIQAEIPLKRIWTLVLKE